MADKIKMVAKHKFFIAYLVFYKTSRYENCRLENGENARLRRTAGKRKIALLKIDSILKKMEVLIVESSKWDYMFKSVE
jgi:hypothetical protein